MLITSLLRGLELATFVVVVVEILLEVFLKERRRQQKAWAVTVTQWRLGQITRMPNRAVCVELTEVYLVTS